MQQVVVIMALQPASFVRGELCIGLLCPETSTEATLPSTTTKRTLLSSPPLIVVGGLPKILWRTDAFDSSIVACRY